jgi:FkbM family methyltransferase
MGWLIGGAFVVVAIVFASSRFVETSPESGLVPTPAPAPPTAKPAPTRDIVGTEHKRYSQFNEEIIVRDFFQDQKNGFFLDIGCAWPIKASTTFFLERHLGWSGIAVDANDIYEPDWVRLRPRSKFLTYLISDHSGSMDTFYAAEALGSIIKNRPFKDLVIVGTEIQVPSITLNDLLEEQGVESIDFLSMDIEESEPAALAGFDIKRYQPKLICIEASPSIRTWILEYFSDNDYERIDRYLEYDTVNWYFKPIDR